MPKKANELTPMAIIQFIGVDVTLIVFIFVTLLFTTVYFTTSYEQTPETARGQILAHKVVECFGGKIIHTSLVTDEQLSKCYPVGDDEKFMYPIEVRVDAQERGFGTSVKAKSANTFNIKTQDVTYPAVIQHEGKQYAGTITVKYEILR